MKKLSSGTTNNKMWDVCKIESEDKIYQELSISQKHLHNTVHLKKSVAPLVTLLFSLPHMKNIDNQTNTWLKRDNKKIW